MSKPQGNNNKRQKPRKEKPEFDQAIVDLARVTRVTKGGKHLSFRALVLIGDRKGKVGYGVEKGADVQIAVDKAVRQAQKNMIFVPFDKKTIPHRVEAKFKAGKVMIKPAPQGSGIIAGSSIRTVLELAGVPNASAKMLGKSNNKISNVKATFAALSSFKREAIEKSRKSRERVEKNKVQQIEVKSTQGGSVLSGKELDSAKVSADKKEVVEKKVAKNDSNPSFVGSEKK
ncbi:MAG: 30S ribosomal protein S5 [Candidatus Magasanikbacteria bacterium CG10_big_fil_rev_8_21_14_0_10_36_16]|uniref:Small ribosomal subunit protein uS5 n=1 Tax=Candidatus Magasanikbacteria bacterium CG10_big_fil_rev_8_21_14_0_10_36_16 TaxID=1974645 RepID=A0A2H0U1C8_9BACT|nr:MAG: 30S ribosomal protein S5 [Candidatus Magasanikbacteria bacterium CG10_big_fil_rev_8_21_14_0_10_36_16]